MVALLEDVSRKVRGLGSLNIMGGELGGEWIHVYVWLSPLIVQLKLSQNCFSNQLYPNTIQKVFF